jgi:5,6-dimethylbenzimidazole synthase
MAHFSRAGHQGATQDRILTPSTSSSSGTPESSAELDTLLLWRRDVRHFRKNPVTEIEMEQLFACAQLAPSVGNSQPWRFLRIRTPSLRTALAEHVDQAARKAGGSYGEGERAALYASLKLHGLREAPEIVAVFSDENPAEGYGLGIATMPEALRYSTVLAIHTMWLTAQSKGLGIGWVSILEPDFVANLLNAPAHWHFIALLCIGHPTVQSDVAELEQRGWQARQNWRSHVSDR